MGLPGWKIQLEASALKNEIERVFYVSLRASYSDVQTHHESLMLSVLFECTS